MKNRLSTRTALLCSILVFATLTSCNQNSANKNVNKSNSSKEVITEQQISLSEKWLKSIFLCSDNNSYCFPDEEKVFTKQYLVFYYEKLEIFEYTDFETENKQIAAEKAFENKWKDIYPLNKDFWAPLGRGNGIEVGCKLENVTITHISDLIFSVIIDYGDENIQFNALTLVPSGDAFLIDYNVTYCIDVDREEGFLPFLQNLTLANLQLGVNPLDAKRLLGKPKSENVTKGPLQVSGFLDENQIVTTTTLEYDGIRLIYDDERMIHADINKPGKNFGWIICCDKDCNKDFIIKRFKLNEDNFYKNKTGDEILIINWEIISLEITFDNKELVKKIEMNTGP